MKFDIGLLNDEDKKFIKYLSNKIDDYIEEKGSMDRGILVGALFYLCTVTFGQNTPFKGDLKRINEEIEGFVYYLKKRIAEL